MSRPRGGAYPAFKGLAFPHVGVGKLPSRANVMKSGAIPFSDNLMQWVVGVDIFQTATNTNFAAHGLDTNAIYVYWTGNNAATPAELDLPVTLAAGTWVCEILHTKSSNQGIIDVKLDGTTVGSVDTYNPTLLYNQRTQTPAFSVGTTGKHTVKLSVTTKNPSATNYYVYPHHLQFRRTA